MSTLRQLPSRPHPVTPGWVILLLILFGMESLVGLATAWRVWSDGDYGNEKRITGSSSKVQPRAIAPRGDLAEDEKSTIKLFQNSSPSVVHITTLTIQSDMFNFNVQKIPRGSGSGFIWDDKGHVVTNYHVIEGANAAQVALADRTTVAASLIGADPSRDIAVLKIKIDQEKLRPILLGESHDLQVGQKVFAIGNPFGLDHSLSTGVVSGLGREVNTGRGQVLHGMIQTDAAINPGNSGGPLLDSAGRLIGVNTAILSPSGASAGIGFAMPVDDVRWVVTMIINRDHADKSRPSLGIDFVSDHLAQSFGIEGVLFYNVDPNGASAQAGLIPTTRGSFRRILIGDIIVALNGQPVRIKNDLMRVLSGLRPGEVVTLTVVRNDQRINVQITLGKEKE